MKKALSVQPLVEPLSIKFNHDYDIHTIDALVRIKFRNQVLLLCDMKVELSNFIERRNNCTAVGDYNNLTSVIDALTKEIYQIESASRVKRYNSLSKPILDAYDTVPRIEIRLDTDENGLEHKQICEMRYRIVMSYIEMVREFYHVEVVREGFSSVISPTCRKCGRDISDAEVGVDGYQSCECGMGRYVPRNDCMMEKGKGKNKTNKDYDDCDNFVKAFKRYIGKQDNIGYNMAALCSCLEHYFVNSNNKMKSCEYYKQLPCDRWGKKDGTSLSLLLEGLKAIGCPKLYEDHNLIGHHMWGWKLPQLEHLLDTLVAHYRATQSVYKSMSVKERGRSSSLSVAFRLYKQLEMLGVEVRIEDFKMPIQPDSRLNQEELWKKMCNGANDPNIFYIRTR
jgi:hypothetical protein